MTGEVVSLNTGLPRLTQWRGKPVWTGIFKAPVEGRLRMRMLNLDGDGQADLSVHGGPDKAVYVYPAEHYTWWQAELGAPGFGWGAFGENLTTVGLIETDVHIGDRFRIGTAEVVVTQPRLPCYKLGVRFGRADMPKRFLASRRTGFYLRVVEEGEVGAGDAVEQLDSEPNEVAVTEITELYLGSDAAPAALRRVLRVAALPDVWRDEFEARLNVL